MMYDHYGDLDVLRDHYPNVKAWVENVKAGWKSTGLKNIWYEYGDWVPPPPYGQTDGHLISSFPFLRDVMTVAQMAALLNDTATQQAYTEFYAQLAQEFHSSFYTNDQIGYANGYQTANALALALPGVVPDNLTQVVVKALVSDIQAKGHLTTGIVGVAQLFPVLSRYGHHDVALMLAQSTTYPSYGWMFSNAIENATTLWELWDSPMEGPGMNSRNHIMFGSVSAWFYRYVAGVQLNGLQDITIRPAMGYGRRAHAQPAHGGRHHQGPGHCGLHAQRRQHARHRPRRHRAAQHARRRAVRAAAGERPLRHAQGDRRTAVRRADSAAARPAGGRPRRHH